MKTVVAKSDQTLRDIAVQYYGNAEAMGKILADNPGLKNDPAALATLGIEDGGGDAFYLDVSIMPGSRIGIDTDSNLIKNDVLREIEDDVTTFNI